MLYYNRPILHFFDLLKYLIIHLSFGLALLELVGFLPLDLPRALIFLFLAGLSPLLLLPCPLLLAVDADAQSNHAKYEQRHRNAYNDCNQVDLGHRVRIGHIHLDHEGVSPGPRGWRGRRRGWRWEDSHYFDVATTLVEEGLSVGRSCFEVLV